MNEQKKLKSSQISIPKSQDKQSIRLLTIHVLLTYNYLYFYNWIKYGNIVLNQLNDFQCNVYLSFSYRIYIPDYYKPMIGQ